MDHYYGWRDVAKVLLSRKRTLWLSLLAGLLVFTAAALLMPKYYRSSARFFSYNIQLFNPRNEIARTPLDVFSGLEESDRLITLASSSGIENMIIKKFRLASHYGIDTTEKGYRGELVEELRSNYKVIKNERGAIEVIVWDRDPELAAAIANEVVSLADLLNKQPLVKSNRQLAEVYDRQYAALTASEAKDSAEVHTKGAQSALLKDNEASWLSTYYERTMLELQSEKMEQLNSIDWQSLYIVETAVPAEKAALPRIGFIIAAGTIFCMLLTAAWFVTLDFYHKEKQQQATT